MDGEFVRRRIYICMYIYMCVYIYIHTHTHTYIYIKSSKVSLSTNNTLQQHTTTWQHTATLHYNITLQNHCNSTLQQHTATTPYNMTSSLSTNTFEKTFNFCFPASWEAGGLKQLWYLAMCMRLRANSWMPLRAAIIARWP